MLRRWPPELSALLGGIPVFAGGRFNVVPRRIDDLERGLARDAALLNESALSGFQEFVEGSGRAGGEAGLQEGEHFGPAETFAVNDAIGLLELQNLVGCVAVATQADFIEANDLRDTALDHDERRDILRDAGQ